MGVCGARRSASAELFAARASPQWHCSETRAGPVAALGGRAYGRAMPHRHPARLVSVFVCLAASLASAGCGDRGGVAKSGSKLQVARHVRVLRLLNGTGLAGPLELFADEVARRSGGGLRIEILNNVHLRDPAYEERIIRDVQHGRAQLAWVGARAWDSVGVESFQALVAPFLVDSYALQERVLRSPLAPRMLAGLDRLGLVGIGLLPGPMRTMLGIDRTFRRPADFVGARIAIQRSRVADATFRALGARTVALASAGKLAGVDGLEQQLGSIASNAYERGARSVTANLILWPRPLVLFTSGKFLATLSDADRQAVTAAARDLVADFTSAAVADDRYGTGLLCRAGFPLALASPRDLDALHAAVRPVYAMLARHRQTRDFIVAIRRLRNPREETQPPACARRPTTSAAASTPLDGVYRMSVSRAALAKHDGVPPSEATPENYGDFTLVVDHDRFAFTQENHDACTWQYGKLALNGDRMQWDFTDGGGIAPTNAQNKPGEHFVWKATLYHQTLRLRPITPTDLTSQTWHRVTRRPSPRFLSRRCPPPAKALP